MASTQYRIDTFRYRTRYRIDTKIVVSTRHYWVSPTGLDLGEKTLPVLIDCEVKGTRAVLAVVRSMGIEPFLKESGD